MLNLALLLTFYLPAIVVSFFEHNLRKKAFIILKYVITPILYFIYKMQMFYIMTFRGIQSDIFETEPEGQGMTNRMELSSEINQDLFLCMF